VLCSSDQFAIVPENAVLNGTWPRWEMQFHEDKNIHCHQRWPIIELCEQIVVFDKQTNEETVKLARRCQSERIEDLWPDKKGIFLSTFLF